MGGEQAVDGDGRLADGAAGGRWEIPGPIRLEGEDVEFVEGHPVAPTGPGPVPRPRPGGEPGRGVGPEPELLAQPGRVGEVVEGHQGRQPPLHAPRDDTRTGRGPPCRPRPRPVSSRAHSTPRGGRCRSRREAARSRASSGRAQNPQALPDGSTRPTRSHAGQLLAGSPGPLNPPSTWYPAVATPNRKPLGQRVGRRSAAFAVPVRCLPGWRHGRALSSTADPDRRGRHREAMEAACRPVGTPPPPTPGPPGRPHHAASHTRSRAPTRRHRLRTGHRRSDLLVTPGRTDGPGVRVGPGRHARPRDRIERVCVVDMMSKGDGAGPRIARRFGLSRRGLRGDDHRGELPPVAGQPGRVRHQCGCARPR